MDAYKGNKVKTTETRSGNPSTKSAALVTQVACGHVFYDDYLHGPKIVNKSYFTCRNLYVRDGIYHFQPPPPAPVECPEDKYATYARLNLANEEMTAKLMAREQILRAEEKLVSAMKKTVSLVQYFKNVDQQPDSDDSSEPSSYEYGHGPSQKGTSKSYEVKQEEFAVHNSTARAIFDDMQDAFSTLRDLSTGPYSLN